MHVSYSKASSRTCSPCFRYSFQCSVCTGASLSDDGTSMLGNSTLRVHFGVVKTENPLSSSGKPRRKDRPSIKSDLYVSSAGESTSAGETSGGDYTQTDDSETELGTHVVGRGRRDLRSTATGQAVYQRPLQLRHPLRHPPQEPSLWLSTPPESGRVRGVSASFGEEGSFGRSQNRSQNRSQSRSRSQSPRGVERSRTSREQDAMVRHMARMGSGASIRQQRIEAAEKAAVLDRQRKAAVDAEVTALVVERRRRRAETAAALNRSRTADGAEAPQDGFSFRNSSAQPNSWVPNLQPPWLTSTHEPLPNPDFEFDPPSILQEPLLEMEAASSPVVASPRYVVLHPPPMISPNRLSPVVGHTSIPQRPSPPSLPTVADATTVYLNSGHSKRRRRNTGVPFEQQSWPRLPDSGSDRE